MGLTIHLLGLHSACHVANDLGGALLTATYTSFLPFLTLAAVRFNICVFA